MTLRSSLACLLACGACTSSSPANPVDHSATPGAAPTATSEQGTPPPSSGAAAAETPPPAASPMEGGGGDDGSDDAGPAEDGAVPAVVSFDFDACSPNPPTGDFPLAVGAAIKGKCQTCHGVPQRHGAPFQIVNYEDVVMPFSNSNGTILRWQRMYEVIQPGSIPHMPLSGPPLTSAEMKTLDDWFAACAPPVPEGTGADQDTSMPHDGGSAADAPSE